MSESLLTKDPARSRPLSANVKRIMKAARATPENPDVIKMARPFEARDYVYCDMQGNIFMEAALKGRPMEEFAPLWMNSQMAGIFDVSFASAGGMETDRFANLLRIPLLLKTPEKIVDTLYWVDMVVRDQENKAMALYEAMLGLPAGEAPDMSKVKLPAALTAQKVIADKPQYPPPSEYHIGQVEAPDLTHMEYAYWLGFVYRCESLLHEESSHMVYGAFDEAFMWDYYREYVKRPEAGKDLSETAVDICRDIDRILVKHIWPKVEQ